MLTVSPSQAVS
ncbi:hypothetical protein YPPY102_2248, partial [Yersinia pestis PY-102]